MKNLLSHRFLKAILLSYYLLSFLFASANEFENVINIGGNNSDIGKCISKDNYGNIYLAINFNSSELDLGNGLVIQNNSTDFYDIALIKYNASSCAVIWAKGIGSSRNERALDINTDTEGNVVLVGYFDSGSITLGQIELTNSGFIDMLVIKIDSLGNFLWGNNAEGSRIEEASNVSIDNDNNIYIAGHFNGDTFKMGNTTLRNANYVFSQFYKQDVFIAKLNKNGNYLWSRSFEGGTLIDLPLALNVDLNNNIYVGGFFESDSLYIGNKKVYNSFNGGEEAFWAKFNNIGQIQWIKTIGGQNRDRLTDMDIDEEGSILLTGYFESPYIVIDNDTQYNRNIDFEVFIAKFNSLEQLQWIKSFGGERGEFNPKIATDNFNNIFLTCSYNSNIINIEGWVLRNIYEIDFFMLKLNKQGNSIWAKTFGGELDEEVNNIVIDAAGNIYITGYYSSEQLKFDENNTFINNGNNNAFFAKLNSTFLSDFVQDYSKINIFPNPTKSSFKIDYNDSQELYVIITNVLGQKIYESNINSKTVISINNGSGIYFLTAKINDRIFSRKIIVN